jgi:tetratricopeptide (TPR) repeat protein
MLVDTAVIPDGHFLGWSPGRVPAAGADDMAWRLEKDNDLVLQLHLLPTGKPEVVEADIGLFFADRVPTRHPVVLLLGSKTIDIPAGQDDYVIEDRYVLPVDVDVVHVYPHAHYLAREMKAVAKLPDGSTKWLLRIARWNFKWQDEYTYVRPIALPRGTTITMQYTYDNSEANESNPHRPPRRVVYGSRSTDEMGDLLLQLIPRNPADRSALERGVELKALQADIARFERMVTDDPRDHEKHNALAFRYTRVGETDKAIAHLEKALGLKPDYVHAHFNLGNVLAARGRLDEGIRHLRIVVRLQPNHAEAHHNLGYALASLGRLDEAVREFRRALAINPDYADARRNLGRALAARGEMAGAIDELRQAVRLEPESAMAHHSLAAALADGGHASEAVGHWEEALRLDPESIESLAGLSWMLATHPDGGIRRPERAVMLASKAAAMTNRPNAVVLDTLAAALASAGRFDEALVSARMSLDAASAAGDAELTAGIRARIVGYGQRVPYRDRRWLPPGSRPE